jgi:hypothetical protein
VVGNKENEFLNAWYQNVQHQNVTVVQNNSFAGLIVDYVFNFNYKDQNVIEIEPMQLYLDLRNRAFDKKLDTRAKWFPQSPEWMTRKIQEIKVDLKAANILVEVGRDGNRRWIRFKKILRDSSKIDQYTT